MAVLGPPARAEWVRSPASGLSTAPLRAVSLASPDEVWAAGGTDTAAVIVRCTDLCATLDGAELVQGHGATGRLDAIWASLGGDEVHAFGPENRRASFNKATSTWDTASVFGPGERIDVAALVLLGGGTAYLAGRNAATGEGYLGRWAEGTFAVQIALPPATGPVVGLAYAAADDGYLIAGPDLLRHGPDGTVSRLATLGLERLTGVSLLTSRVVVVGSDPNQQATYVVRRPADSVVLASQPVPFAATAVTMASEGFAVAVGLGGRIAASQDGGNTWKTRASPTTQDLLAVDCWDGNTCVAVGAGGEVVFFRNAAPAAAVSAGPAGLDVEEGSLVCLTATNLDPDGDDVAFRWTDPHGFASETGQRLDGDTSPTPPCFRVPTDVCQERIYPLSLRISDGRRVADMPVALRVLDTVKQPPSAPEVEPGPPLIWTLGGTVAVTASAVAECGRSVHFEFAPESPLPQPSLDGLDLSTATFDLRRVTACEPGPTAFSVVTVDSAGLRSSATRVPVELVSAPYAPYVELSFSDGFSNGAVIPEGAGTTVTIAAEHACAPQLEYVWWCDGEPEFYGPSRRFENPGALCAVQTVSCHIEVAAPGHPTAATQLTLQYAPSGRIVTRVDLEWTQGNTLKEGESTELTVRPHSLCNPSYQVHWDCVGAPSPPDGTLKHTFVHPGDPLDPLCEAAEAVCTVTAIPDDGNPPGVATAVVSFERSPVSTVFPLPVFDPPTDKPTAEVLPGGSIAVEARPQNACNPPFKFDWDCQWSPKQQTEPLDDGPRQTFSHPGNICVAFRLSCLVTASAPGWETPYPKDFTVQFLSVPVPAQVSHSFVGYDGKDPLPPGMTAEVNVYATNECRSSFGFRLDAACPARVVEVTASSLKLRFENPGDLCWDTPVACTVDAFPTDGNLQGADEIRLTLARRNLPEQLTPAFSNGFGDGDTLLEGQSTVVTVDLGSPCTSQVRYRWECCPPGQPCVIDNPPDNTRELAIHHPGVLCEGQSLACTIRALPAVGPEAVGSFVLFFARSDTPPSVEARLGGALAKGVLREGEEGDIELQVGHACGTPVSVSWMCDNLDAPPAGTLGWSIRHPGMLCSDVPVLCRATATPEGSFPPAIRDVELTLARSELVTNLGLSFSDGYASGSVLEQGKATTVTVDPTHACCPPGKGACLPQFDIDWQCQGASPPRGATEVVFAHPGELCEDHRVRCVVRATPKDGRAPATAEFELRYARGDFGVPALAPPEPRDYEPGPEVEVDCRSSVPVVLRPRVTAPAPCPVAWEWRQLTSLPLLTEPLEDGALEIRLPADKFAWLLGKSARFEVKASVAGGETASRQFEVRFSPRRVVTLKHQADVSVLGFGDQAELEVRLHNRCAHAVAALDVLVGLEGLAYLPGSARLDGRHIADPSSRGTSLVFSNLPTRGLGEEPTVLSYRVRRTAIGGRSLARAQAWMTGDSSLVLSTPEEAEFLPVSEPAPAFTWSCASAGSERGGSGLLTVGLALLALRRRGARPRQGPPGRRMMARKLRYPVVFIVGLAASGALGGCAAKRLDAQSLARLERPAIVARVRPAGPRVESREPGEEAAKRAAELAEQLARRVQRFEVEERLRVAIVERLPAVPPWSTSMPAVEVATALQRFLVEESDAEPDYRVLRMRGCSGVLEVEVRDYGFRAREGQGALYLEGRARLITPEGRALWRMPLRVEKRLGDGETAVALDHSGYREALAELLAAAADRVASELHSE